MGTRYEDQPPELWAGPESLDPTPVWKQFALIGLFLVVGLVLVGGVAAFAAAPQIVAPPAMVPGERLVLSTGALPPVVTGFGAPATAIGLPLVDDAHRFLLARAGEGQAVAFRARWAPHPGEPECPVESAMSGAALGYVASCEGTGGPALRCTQPAHTKFDRKDYLCPDLPKGYQISQCDLPLNVKGWLELPSGKRVGITRAHLEEDTGTLKHGEDAGRKYTLVDFNRSGVPLLEIVSEPDMSSAEEGEAYVRALRDILIFSGVSEMRLEEGAGRFDVNVSIRSAIWALGLRRADPRVGPRARRLLRGRREGRARPAQGHRELGDRRSHCDLEARGGPDRRVTRRIGAARRAGPPGRSRKGERL